MDSLKILQVVGYKNSGKTTLLKNWIKQCSAEGEEVAVIKHHGHPNGLMMPPSITDSMIFFEAGAKSSIVSDHTIIQLHQRKDEWSLEQSIALAKVSEPSIIFIEGFKLAHYPKVVLVKNESEWQSLRNLTHIALVVCHENITIQNYPALSIHQTKEIDLWFKHWIRGDFHKTV